MRFYQLTLLETDGTEVIGDVLNLKGIVSPRMIPIGVDNNGDTYLPRIGETITLDGYSGHSALWLDHILFRSDIEEVYACQKCGKRCKVKKYA